MIVLDVIKFVCKNLGLDELLSVQELGGTETADADQLKQIESFIDCVNDVNQSIAFMYLPLKTYENITISNKKFAYSDFSKTLIELLSLKNEAGLKQKFYTYPTFITCENGSYTASYTYVPNYVSNLSDTIEINQKVDARTLAYGVVAKFYLLKALFSEANAWDARFQQALLVASRKKGEVKMCGRWWT